MSRFDKAVRNRNRIIDRHARRYAFRVKWEVFKKIRKGMFIAEVGLEDLGLYSMPENIIKDVYDRTINILNCYYGGDVFVEMSYYNPSGNRKSIIATIVKV